MPLNTKAIFVEQLLQNSWEDKGVHTFPKVISPKVNVIGQLEFELAYNDVTVQDVNHYTMRTSLINDGNSVFLQYYKMSILNYCMPEFDFFKLR